MISNTDIQDDIVKQILRNNEFLKPEYYDSLDAYTRGNVEIAQLGTKLNSLSDSIMSAIIDDVLPLQNLISILEEIENYALNLVDEELQSQLAIMFFETIEAAVNDVDRNSPKLKYLRVINNNLGILSKEICEQHNIHFKQI